jgi:hypothetical protein
MSRQVKRSEPTDSLGSEVEIDPADWKAISGGSGRVVFNPFPITRIDRPIVAWYAIEALAAPRRHRCTLWRSLLPVPAIVAPDAIRAHDGMECRAWPGAANPQPCSDASGFGQS